MTLRRMSLKVSSELYEFISEQAAKEGLSMNAIIIFALNSYKDQKTVVPGMSVMQDLLERIEQEEANQRSVLK